MCVLTQNDPRMRAASILGVCGLVFALGSQSLNLSFGLGPAPLHFLRGLGLGIYIAVQLRLVWLARKRRAM
jgi:hypothetical protein